MISKNQMYFYLDIKNKRNCKKDIKSTCISKTPNETKNDYLVSSTYRFNIIKILKEIKNTRIFVNGGGTLLQDVSSLRSIMYYLFLNKIAIIMKKRIMLYANGIGPVKRKISKFLINKIINKVNLITLRDERSFSALKELKVNKPQVYITFDCAFALDPDYTDKVKKIKNEIDDFDKDKVKTVIVSVRQWKKSKTINQAIFNEKLAEKLDEISNKYKVKIVFIPMRYLEDLKEINDINKKMKSDSYIIKEMLTESEKMAIMGYFDITIAMRLHALIYSARVTTPMVGISYDIKVDGLLELIDQPIGGRYEDIDSEKLINAFDICYNNQDKMKKKLERQLPVLMELSHKNAKLLLEMLEDE